RRQKCAHIRGSERRQVFERRRAAQMLGEKMQELLHVAAVGVDGLGRQMAFGMKMPQPGIDLRRDFGSDESAFRILRHIRRHVPLVPAEAGSQLMLGPDWIPAFAGMGGDISRSRLYPS